MIRNDRDSSETKFFEELSYLADGPVYDFHTHLPVELLLENQPLSNLSACWVEPDHYKLRVLRHLGLLQIENSSISQGDSLAMMWLDSLPHLVGSPLLDWAKLELEMFFGWELEDAISNPSNFVSSANEMLGSELGRPRELLRQSGFRAIATSDEPFADVGLHALSSDSELRVMPTFRIDRFLQLEHVERFLQGIDELCQRENREIRDVSSFLEAIEGSLVRFHEAGSRLADCGIGEVQADVPSPELAESGLKNVLKGVKPSASEIRNWQRLLLDHLAEFCASHRWTMQIHFGALRNINKDLFEVLGPDSGGDSIGNPSVVDLAATLSDWSATGILPRLIIYVSNPTHSAAMSALSLVFFERDVKGLVRLGAPWWFLDTPSGIRDNLTVQAEIGVLSTFPGMVSDSRSFFSAARHQYFRRELISFLSEGIMSKRFSHRLLEESETLEKILFHNPREIFTLEG